MGENACRECTGMKKEFASEGRLNAQPQIEKQSSMYPTLIKRYSLANAIVMLRYRFGEQGGMGSANRDN